MSSRLEINIGGLLHCCEKMVAEKRLKDWRLRKYVDDLGEKMVQLEKELRKPSADLIKDYHKRIELLKKLLEAENLTSIAENIKVMQNIKPGTALSSGDVVQPTRDVYIKARSTLASQMRSELLGSARSGVGPTSTGTELSSDVDAVLQHHKQSQEKLAEEMVFLAKNMKEHALAASKIVQEDNRRLTDADKLASDNAEKLRVESGRLEEHVHRAGKWWMWLALAAVVIIFIVMILFMRLFPKPRSAS